MPSDDLMDWLGPLADQLTTAQIDTLRAEAAAIHARYPDPDESHERDAAMSAVVQYLLRETTAAEVAGLLAGARTQERMAFASATWTAVMMHRTGGTRKATAAAACGIDRMSLLKALGERPTRDEVEERTEAAIADPSSLVARDRPRRKD